MNEMQARHKGFVEKRTWHKIKWIKGRHEGRFDIFDDEDLKKNKDSVEIIETFQTEKCATGVSYDFGRTSEDQINEWVKENRR